MNRQLVLIGAGDHGRGTLEILRARAAAGLPVPEVLGFVDDDPAVHGRTLGGLPVLGGLEWFFGLSDRPAALLALASAGAKRALVQRTADWGMTWETAVHPSAILGAGTVVMPGAIVGAGVIVAYDTTIGPHTTINLGCTVGHDCVIGAYSTVAPGVNITGKVVLGEGVEIQTNATLVPGISIGDGARVGPGSVVLRDVAAGDFVFGSPARKMPVLDPRT